MKKIDKGRVLLGHGSGGTLSRDLVEGLFARVFDNPILAPLGDQAVFRLPAGRLAFTTDSYVVSPIFFPGGDIGKLSVCGTVNDLAVGGAEPVYMSASFIIEEGMELEELERVASSMARAAADSGVKIVTGDTKVVERGKGDRLFINTAGIGVIADSVELGPANIRAGDAVIVSGPIGDHGVAILAHREGIEMDSPVESDCAALDGLVKAMLAATPSGAIRAMRDPTRGGVATVINEFARSSATAMLIREADVPVREAVRGACELLGFDPLYLANEGKLIAVVDRDKIADLLKAMRAHPLGKEAAVIGEVLESTGSGNGPTGGRVFLETTIGNRRVLDMLSGEQLPRIC